MFPAPAVAGELGPNWVEARLHTDGGPRETENRELQLELVGKPGNPVYVLQNPWTERAVEILDRPDTVAGFKQFLARNRDAALDQETAAR